MDSCCRKRLWMAMATFSSSQSTLTAPVRFSRSGRIWEAGWARGTEAALVTAGVGGCSGPGAREDPGSWVALPGEPPARHKETEAKGGSALRACEAGSEGSGWAPLCAMQHHTPGIAHSSPSHVHTHIARLCRPSSLACHWLLWAGRPTGPVPPSLPQADSRHAPSRWTSHLISKTG